MPGIAVHHGRNTQYFRAVRQIGIGSIHLAHVTKAGDNADQRPFGSTFWHNSARGTWFVKRADDLPDGDQRVRVGLFNRKATFGTLGRAVGIEIGFDGDQTLIQPVNIADVDDLAVKLPLWQRMQRAVRHKPLTLAVLAEELGTSVDTLDRTVRRKSSLFVRVPDDDGVTRIALTERRVS